MLFRSHGDHIHQGPVAPHRDLHASADGVLYHPPLQLSAGPEWFTGNRDQDVANPETSSLGRTSRDHLCDPQPFTSTKLLRKRWRERSLASCYTEPRPSNPADGHQCADDSLRGLVDRHGQTYADTRDRRVHADHLTAAVSQDAAAVARVIDFPAVIAAMTAIGFDKWAELETDAPKELKSDMRRNLGFIRNLAAKA